MRIIHNLGFSPVFETGIIIKVPVITLVIMWKRNAIEGLFRV